MMYTWNILPPIPPDLSCFFVFFFFLFPGELMDNVCIIFHPVADFLVIESLPVDYCNCA